MRSAATPLLDAMATYHTVERPVIRSPSSVLVSSGAGDSGTHGSQPNAATHFPVCSANIVEVASRSVDATAREMRRQHQSAPHLVLPPTSWDCRISSSVSRTADPSCETRCESESTGSPLDSEPLDCLLDCQLERRCVKLSIDERFDIRARETRCDMRLRGVTTGAGGAVVASPPVKSCTLSEPRLGLQPVDSSPAAPAPSGPVVAMLAPARGLNCLALKLAEALFCAGETEGSDAVRLCAGDGGPAVSISLGSRLVREHAGLEELRFRFRSRASRGRPRHRPRLLHDGPARGGSRSYWTVARL